MNRHLLRSLATASVCLLLLTLGCDSGGGASSEGAADADPQDTATSDAPEGDAPEGDASSGGPRVTLSGPSEASGCDAVTVTASVEGDAASLDWSLEGLPLIAAERGDDGLTLVIEAPVVTTETTLTARLTATDAQGAEGSDAITLIVAPTAPGEGLSEGMAAGCGPFPHGVASGDPEGDSVLLWTRVTSPGDAAAVELRWVVAADRWFEQIVSEGIVSATAERDHTVTVEAGGLTPGTTYYYRFESGEARSPLGRTRTAPAGPTERVRLASMSCSSIFSGYFNAYGRLAERDDLDAVVHLGDYLYDFVDENERVRVPTPEPPDPDSQALWRARHRYYLSDPDLRRARAAHPWVVIWDNHDVDDDGDRTQRVAEVFREYVPMRPPVVEGDPRVAYRALRFGDLVDLILIDALLHRTEDDILGPAQWSWLTARLRGAPTAWRVIGNQKLVSTLFVPGGLLDPGNWDDYPQTRARLFELLGEADDNLILSGDLHFTIAADLVDRPTDPMDLYDPATDAERSVGVELLATSISRGNFDEQLCSGRCDEGNLNIITVVQQELAVVNPHIAAAELIEHGYGVLDITAERVTAELWYSPIREPSRDERLGATLVVERGANQWTRSQ
ncbi:MAG: hypothetical protein CMH57_11405 [Myxococcales bacterium]|nr:hypothetical protein [Myxococcales bacterium]